MSLPKKILVPADFEEASLAALDQAVELADALGGSVEVVHVWSNGRNADKRAEATIARPPETREQATEALGRIVERARRVLGDRVTGEVVEGEAFRAIVQRAVDEHCDLVVMGTHAREGRLHSFMGSVAEDVLRLAPCPVMIVRVPLQEAA